MRRGSSLTAAQQAELRRQAVLQRARPGCECAKCSASRARRRRANVDTEGGRAMSAFVTWFLMVLAMVVALTIGVGLLLQHLEQALPL